MFTTKTASHPLHKLVLAAGAVALLGTASLSHANDVVALKHALYGAGYDINNVNPKLDEHTRAELTQYQEDQGLEASGTLNEETKEGARDGGRCRGCSRIQGARSGSCEAGK